MSDVIEFSDAGFDTEVLGADTPVLVDFWAPWCGPCRMIAPVVEELAVENSGSVKVGKINIDDNPQTAQKFNVSSIPTMMVFKAGEVVGRLVGGVSKHKLQELLDEAKG
ncbi:MAG: thioredoxin [Pirellulales bacterium]|jgi:thioredoxin 1|nr:thioredoxin [Pirellulales bacterium]